MRAVLAALVLAACVPPPDQTAPPPAPYADPAAPAAGPPGAEPQQPYADPAAPAPAPAPAAAPAAELVGVWVQDAMGSPFTYRRYLQFNADGSYALTITRRPSGSTQETPVGGERGTFRAEGGTLVLTPASGNPSTLAWRIDRDPYVGDVRFVIVRPDGGQDVYYRR